MKNTIQITDTAHKQTNKNNQTLIPSKNSQESNAATTWDTSLP